MTHLKERTQKSRDNQMAEVVHRGASEADAGRILQDIKDGKVTINDLLGSLYNKGESPSINIPRGRARRHLAPRHRPSRDSRLAAQNEGADDRARYAMEPATCEHRISAISHVGRSDAAEPSRADKHDLVVIGAGVVGLLSVIVGKSLGRSAS